MMQNILARWQTLPREDLFDFWQNELALKKELRSQAEAYQEVKLESEADFQFIRQSLAYGEERQLFFKMLFANMNHQPIQFALVNGPEELYLGFMHALPEIIDQESPSPRALQFLINLYREELQAYFTEILRVLNKPACDYLLERTASKSLRQLLSSRQQEIEQQYNDKNNGNLSSLESTQFFQGIFADKIQSITRAIKNSYLEQTHQDDTANSLESLQAAELLLMSGALNDCMTLLSSIFQHQHDQGVWRYAGGENHLKVLQRLLNKTLPVYFLLNHPLQASQCCLQCYQQDFPGLPADESSLLYLDLYTRLLANYHGNPAYTMLEMINYEKGKAVSANHNLLAWLRNLHQGGPAALAEISRYAHDRISVLPHESFIIMEFIRWLTSVKRIMPDREINDQLLRDYIRLYQWIPSPLFMNQDIRSQLAVSADDKIKQEADRIFDMQTQYSFSELKQMYKVKSEVFLHDPVFKRLSGLFLGGEMNGTP